MFHSKFTTLAIATLMLPLMSFADEQTRYPVGAKTEKKKQQETESNYFSRTYPSIYFPSGTHCLLSVSAYGNEIEIEDGSVWSISSYDAPKVAAWGSQDPIIITQNHRWFSRYNYRIINQATGGILEANLRFGPIKNGPYTRYVAGIDYLSGEIILNDLTRWQVSVLDQNDLSGWLVDDAIIVGYNSGWDSDCHGLLINVNKNDHIRAAQY